MTIQSARKRIALNGSLIGLGILLIYLPMAPAFMGFTKGMWTLLLFPLILPAGFYVIGYGISGIALGIIELVRNTK